MMKKILLTSIALLGSVCSALADTALIVWADETEPVEFLLSERPKVTFGNDDLLIDTRESSISFPVAKGIRFTFEDRDPQGSVEETYARPSEQFRFTDVGIECYGLEPGTQTRLFDMQGRMLLCLSADSEGHTLIPSDNLSRGIYVINTGKTSFKVSIK